MSAGGGGLEDAEDYLQLVKKAREWVHEDENKILIFKF